MQLILGNFMISKLFICIYFSYVHNNYNKYNEIDPLAITTNTCVDATMLQAIAILDTCTHICMYLGNWPCILHHKYLIQSY